MFIIYTILSVVLADHVAIGCQRIETSKSTRFIVHVIFQLALLAVFLGVRFLAGVSDA